MSNEHTEGMSESRAGGNGEGGIAARSHEAAQQLKNVAEERAQRVRHAAESVKEQTAKRVRKLGVAVRAIGENMRIDDEQWMARYADTASQRLDDVATYLTDHDAHDVLEDAEQFMRRRPTWFFGGALLVGLAAGRFLKSSRPHFSPDSQSPGAAAHGGSSKRANAGASQRDGRGQRNGTST